eukprot:4183371-Pyramimonas_sp.AAC.1
MRHPRPPRWSCRVLRLMDPGVAAAILQQGSPIELLWRRLASGEGPDEAGVAESSSSKTTWSRTAGAPCRASSHADPPGLYNCGFSATVCDVAQESGVSLFSASGHSLLAGGLHGGGDTAYSHDGSTVQRGGGEGRRSTQRSSSTRSASIPTAPPTISSVQDAFSSDIKCVGVADHAAGLCDSTG